MERVKHTGRNGTGGENSAGDIGGEGGVEETQLSAGCCCIGLNYIVLRRFVVSTAQQGVLHLLCV